MSNKPKKSDKGGGSLLVHGARHLKKKVVVSFRSGVKFRRRVFVLTAA